jgi:hypothetical protein
MVQITKDRVTGMITIGVGIFVISASMLFPPSKMPGDPGPKIFPIISAIIMIVTGAGLVISRPKEKDKVKKPYLTKEQWVRFFKLLGAYLLYFALLWLFGFLPATLVSFFLVSTMFMEGQKVVIWKQILITLIVTFGVFFLFQYALGLRLPQGTLLRLDI